MTWHVHRYDLRSADCLLDLHSRIAEVKPAVRSSALQERKVMARLFAVVVIPAEG